MKGYYLVLGDCPEGRDEPASSDERQMRLYWHLTSEAAAQLVAAATEILNAASIPFLLKVLRKPITYARADAGVMYIGLRHFARLGDAIAQDLPDAWPMDFGPRSLCSPCAWPTVLPSPRIPIHPRASASIAAGSSPGRSGSRSAGARPTAICDSPASPGPGRKRV